MRWFSQKLAWALFLVLVGVFLLLKNLGVFQEWGDVIWGGLFAVVGLGFLIWFLFNAGGWWRAIPGFTLLSIGAMTVLEARGMELGRWGAGLILFGVALGFWASFLARKENWWAIIPGGVLTVVGVLVGLEESLSRLSWLGLFFVGLGLVFALLYFLHPVQLNTRWAAIPMAALILVGLVTLVSALSTTQTVLQWWPVLLLVGGLGLLAGSLGRAGKAPPVVAPPDFEVSKPAPGTSISQELPAQVAEPEPPSRTTSAESTPPSSDEGAVDIYALLAQSKGEPETLPPSETDAQEHADQKRG